MPPYSDAELHEIRRLDGLVRNAMQELGFPIVNDTPVDELIASGAFKAAECRVLSKDMVTPGWSERTRPGSGEPF